MVAQDGRDKARRQGITQQQRAVVTYSFSWISAVVAQMPAQLYFRERHPLPGMACADRKRYHAWRDTQPLL